MTFKFEGRKVSQADLAELFGVTTTTIRAWERKGCPVESKGGRGRSSEYNTAAVARWREEQAAARNDDDPALADALARFANGAQPLLSKLEAERVKENYIALLRQLEYDREAGEVAAIEDVAAALSGELALVRGKLLNLGSRLAPQVAATREAALVKAVIDAEVATILQELTADVPDAATLDDLHDAVRKRFAPYGSLSSAHQ